MFWMTKITCHVFDPYNRHTSVVCRWNRIITWWCLFSDHPVLFIFLFTTFEDTAEKFLEKTFIQGQTQKVRKTTLPPWLNERRNHLHKPSLTLKTHSGMILNSHLLCLAEDKHVLVTNITNPCTLTLRWCHKKKKHFLSAACQCMRDYIHSS